MLKIYQIDDGGASHWIIAQDREQVFSLMREKYDEWFGEEGDPFFPIREWIQELTVHKLPPTRNMRFTLSNGTRIELRIHEWIDLFYGLVTEFPVYWGCSEW